MFGLVGEEQILRAVKTLGASELLAVSQDKDERAPSVSLSQEISEYDIRDAFERDPECKHLFS